MELLRIPSEHSITKFDQRGSMIDACVPGASPSRQSLKIIFLPGLQTALTEQLGVVSGSVGTLVDCRNTSRKEFDLLAGDRAKPAGQVIIGIPRPVLVMPEAEETPRLVGHQSERPSDVGARTRHEIRLIGPRLFPYDGRPPRIGDSCFGGAVPGRFPVLGLGLLIDP